MDGFHVIIPVRYDSTRFPGKALADIGGKPMIQYVYEAAIKSGAEDVVIATDDERISEAAKKFGAIVCMTSSDHPSGTARIAEAVVALGFESQETVVCLQGDEPLIPPQAIRKLAEDLYSHRNAKASSLCTPLNSSVELFNPNCVKVVMNYGNYALYFTRAPIPWSRNQATLPSSQESDLTKPELEGLYYRHIGVYAYRAGFLEEYLSWDTCPAEKLESLEQLRILWNGGRIHMVITDDRYLPGVDTKEDLERVREYLAPSYS